MKFSLRNPLALCALVAIGVAALGCGGSDTSQASVGSGTGASIPRVGNYQAMFSAPGSTAGKHNTGTVLMSASPGGSLQVSVSLTGTVGIYVGSATVDGSDTFTSNLSNTSTGGSAILSGTTYLSSVKMNLTGAVQAGNLTAIFTGTANPWANSYTGIIYGGNLGATQTLSMVASSPSTANLTGTMTSTSDGLINFTGVVSPIGICAANIPVASSGDSLNLVGAFTTDANGKAHGSGTWTGTLSTSNHGTWLVTAN